jgi:hypothetical protein
MEKHGMGTSCDNTNEPLDHSILPMRSDTTKGLILIRGVGMILKKFCGKYAVVAVNVLNGNIVALCERLETDFGFQGGLSGSVFLTVGM